MTSSSKLSSRLTSARARSSAMLFRSRSSSISSRAPGEGSCAYRGLLCQRPPIVATHQSMGCQPRIIEVIRQDNTPSDRGEQLHSASDSGHFFITHGRITGAEIHRTGHEALGALATPNGVIAQLHIGMTLLVFLPPFFVERRRKGGAITAELERTNGSTLFGIGVSTGEHAATDSHNYAQHSPVMRSHRWVSSGAQL